PDARISVEGHAWYSNHRSKSLSEQRAVSAVMHLIGTGIDANRLEWVGHGADQPLVIDTDRSNTEANRRIEIKVIEGGE
ncbi:MAG: OmpA family protein, partial [Verrucomicrobiota bacterium]